MSGLRAVDRIRLNRPAFRRWLERCQGTSFAHGHDLVLEMAMADNVAEADRTLKAAEHAGLIVSTGCSPTPQQKFMGVGGLWWSGKAREHWAAYPSTHGWAPGPVRDLEKVLETDDELRSTQRSAG